MIDLPLLTILLLTGFINLIGALAYAARIAGVRTRRIAMSFALFNILVLFSRTSNSFLGPFLAKRIETRIHDGSGTALFIDMQFVLAAASIATLRQRSPAGGPDLSSSWRSAAPRRRSPALRASIA